MGSSADAALQQRRPAEPIPRRSRLRVRGADGGEVTDMGALMERLQDWPSRLAEFVESRRDVGFARGKADCCMLVADAVQAMTGVDYAARWRGPTPPTRRHSACFGTTAVWPVSPRCCSVPLFPRRWLVEGCRSDRSARGRGTCAVPRRQDRCAGSQRPHLRADFRCEGRVESLGVIWRKG